MIVRTFDPTLLNEVANHPEIRPWLGGGGVIDFTPALANPDNVALVNEHGGWIMHKLAPGLYEVHSQFLPEGRGPPLIADMAEGMRYMFTATDCVELVTRVPDDNKAALGIARAGGFRESFRREACWPEDGGPTGVSYQSLPFERWRARDDVIADVGAWFHHQLEQAKIAAGSSLPVHPDDETHDRAVGAAVLMVRAGNPHKAVLSYNRWACFAGYAPVSIVSEHPLILDIADALVTMTPEGGMEVLQCPLEPSPQQ